MTLDEKRAQAIHENNVLRRQNRDVIGMNLRLSAYNDALRDAANKASASQQAMKRTFLRMLQSGELERQFAIGGWANIRERMKAEAGFDGLSQTDIDTMF